MNPRPRSTAPAAASASEGLPGWNARVAALVSAITAIRQADAGCSPHAEVHGGLDRQHRAEQTRDRQAWPHVETVLTHGFQVVAGIRENVLVEDHLDPVIGPELRRFGTVEDALGRLRSVHTGWQDAAALLVGPQESVLRRVEDLRAAEAWPYAARFAAGPLPELAAFVAPRVGTALPDREAQIEAALARTGAAFARAGATAPATAVSPSGHRRSR